MISLYQNTLSDGATLGWGGDVQAPDIRSGDMAASFVEQVMLILSTIGTCDGNIAEGSLRVDANVSVSCLAVTDAAVILVL